MEKLGLAVPRLHDLNRLRAVLLPHHSSLRGLGRGLKFLTGFAVTQRYPGDRASKRQAAAALRWAEKVRTAARALLGIRERRPRRRK
jgi:HEPN domain-containing protein